ncbi:MAG: DUF2795 domain-containing protein [Caldilineaceae bacterium]|nr:DUF2795 domain-containing protein [Caldilineaceae bacterium]
MPINTQSHGNTQAHSETGRRDAGSIANRQDRRIHLAEVKQCLQGVHFPADKSELVNYAKEHHASLRILDTLEQLSTSEFGSPNAKPIPEYKDLDAVLREIEKVDRTD